MLNLNDGMGKCNPRMMGAVCMLNPNDPSWICDEIELNDIGVVFRQIPA